MFHFLKQLPVQELYPGCQARIFHGNEITFAVVEIEPNLEFPPHKHVNEQVGLLVRGSLVFTIDEHQHTAHEGEGWVIPPNAEHCVQSGPEGAVVLETWSPPRHDFLDLPEVSSEARRWPL